MSYEVSKQFSKAPVRSMREVESIEQLEYILHNALKVVELRDEIFMNYGKIAKTKEEQGKLTVVQKQTRRGLWIYGIMFSIVLGFLIYYAVSSDGVTFNSGIIYALILPVSIILFLIYEKSKANKKKQNFGIIQSATRVTIENLEKRAHELSDIVWCAEIIPIRYRNQKAVEIMLTDLQNSRVDTWKECLDIYDKECEKESTRRYQEEQLALSREAANNTAWAAAGAWASFGAILWK
jgi:hypothetical protein